MFTYHAYFINPTKWHSLVASQISGIHVASQRKIVFFVLSSVEKWAFFDFVLKSLTFVHFDALGIVWDLNHVRRKSIESLLQLSD